jgi:RNA polymerase sigma-70 factor (ECF subfamily)
VTPPEPAALTLDTGPRGEEQALIARVLAGDRIAERELYDAHVTRVFRLAYRMCGNTEQARDLVQESFIRVFAQLPRFRGDAALSTWVYRVALSVVANGRRRERRRERDTDIDSIGPIADERVAEADPDLKEQLHAAIDALPEIYRVTVVMHDVEGFTHIDIAEATGVAVGTSKSRLSIARARLRATLAPFMKE